MIAFQSTHPLRGATQSIARSICSVLISIHAPLAGCDVTEVTLGAPGTFQSTPPLRGATMVKLSDAGDPLFQSTPPLRGATLSLIFNIHSMTFQSTPPLRGATTLDKAVAHFIIISIHAPLAGCDLGAVRSACCSSNFNPRPPCGVRLSLYRLM